MQQTIALAGVGSLGKYIYEELTSDVRFNVIVISRQVNELNLPNIVETTNELLIATETSMA